MSIWDEAEKPVVEKGSVWDQAAVMVELPPVEQTPDEAYNEGKNIIDMSVDLGLPIDTIESAYDTFVLWDVPSDPKSIADDALNYNYVPNIEFVERKQPVLRAATRQALKDLDKRLPLPSDALGIEKFDRVLHIIGDPALRIFYKLGKGMLLNSPDAAFALIKKMAPDDMQEVLDGMTLDEAVDWAMDYNPGAVADFMSESAEFIGGISTVGKLIPKAGPGVLAQAGRGAVQFGGAKGAEELAKLTAELVDPDTSYGYQGAKGVVVDMGIGAGFSVLSSAARPLKSAIAGTTFGKAVEEGAHKAAIALTRKFPLVMDTIRKNPQAHFTKQVLRFVKDRTGMSARDMTLTQKAAIKHIAREGERRFLIAYRNYLKNIPPDVVQAVKRRGLALPEGPVKPAAAAPVVKPLAKVAKPGVKPVKAQEAVEPVEHNFTTFARAHGFVDDFSVLDHGQLSPSGKRTKRAHTESMRRMEERIESNKKGHEAFREAILAGEVIDIEGKVTKEGLLAEQKERAAKKVEGRLSQIRAQIQLLRDTGKGKKGTIRPSIQKQIDALEAEKEQLQAQPPTEVKPPPDVTPKQVKEVAEIREGKPVGKTAAFEAYRKAMPNATEEEVVKALIQDGLLPTKKLLEKHADLPEVRGALAGLEIERVAASVMAEDKRISEIPRDELPVSPRPLVDPLADAKELAKQIRARTKWDKKHPGGKVDITPLTDAHGTFMSIIEPSKAVEIAQGKDVYAEVIKATHKADVAMIEFNEKELENLDSTLGEWGKALSKYSNRTLELLMLSRGKPVSKGAILIRDEALAELAKKAPELVGTRKMITRASDFNYDYLAEVVGKDIHYIEDYFYGIYKDPRRVEKFLDYWKTTKRFTKEKKLPTVADAKAFGLDLRDPNPVNNLRSEYLAIARLDGMIGLKQSLMKSGEGDYIANTADAPIDWDKVHDPVFTDVRVAPELAKMINNLIATNKITRQPLLNTVRQVNNFLRTVKFVGSAFHLMVEAKQSVADSGYLGFLHKKTAARGLTTGLKQGDPIFQTPEYKDYIAHGGGHRYSIDSEAQRAFTNSIEKMGKAGGIAKGVALPFQIPEKFVRWMFENYIPKVKYAKYLDTAREQEVKLGRSLASAEKIDIIKEQQNFYGMMNERLFGRSGTVTTLLRMKFMAPGFAEGNFRSMLKAVLQWGGDKGFSAHRSRANIINSFIISAIAASVGTMILTGKPPKKPEKIADIRDIFKIDTGKVDQHGRRIMIDLLTYDKDYWDVFGNIVTGQPGEAIESTVRRLGGMTATTWDVMSDLNQMSMGKAVYDWKGDRVVEITDPFIQRILKLSIHELKKAAPISTNVFQQARKKGVGTALSAAMTLAGVRLTKTEQDKKEVEILNKIFSLRDQQETLYWYLGGIENPREQIKKYNQTVMRILDNPITPLEVKDEYEPKLIIDEKRLTSNRVYAFLGDQARLAEFSRSPDKHQQEIKKLQDDIQKGDKWLRNFGITESQHRSYIVTYEQLHRKIIKEIQPEDDRDALKTALARFYADQTIVKRKIQSGLGTDQDRRLAKKYVIVGNNIAQVARRIYDTETGKTRDSLFDRIELIIGRITE